MMHHTTSKPEHSIVSMKWNSCSKSCRKIKKVPQLTRDEMMNMFQKSWNETCIKVNNQNVFMTNMITIALDGSEDHLPSKKLMDLVGTEMLEF